MEAIVVPYKQIKTPKRNTNCRSKCSYRPDKKISPGDVHGGLSFYPTLHLLSPLPSSFQYPRIHRQPPILQTPVDRPSLPSRTRYLPLSPPNKPARKAIKFRDQSLTPKKSQSPERNKDPKLVLTSPSTKASDATLNASTARLEPDPINLEVDCYGRVLSPSSLSFIGKDFGSVSLEELNKLSGSVFTLSSPHPNSLPLPKFSIRSKRTCNVEVGGNDAGATDNLRRLLRLQ